MFRKFSHSIFRSTGPWKWPLMQTVARKLALDGPNDAQWNSFMGICQTPGSISDPMNNLSFDFSKFTLNDSTFLIEFIGVSQDGLDNRIQSYPDHAEIKVSDGVKEIYERQNNDPPFVYVQIGYAGNETWK